MAMYKTTSEWGGFPGAPGYTNFYFQGTGDGGSAAAVLTETRAFWDALKYMLPGAVTIQVHPEVELIDPATGMMESVQNGTQPAVVQGAGGNQFSAASGACIGWLTGGIRNGRRVRGRTFVVPIAYDQYETNGTLTTNALTALNAAANGLASTEGADLAIWSRPSVKGANDGAVHFVTGVRVVDKVAVLTSRRD